MPLPTAACKLLRSLPTVLVRVVRAASAALNTKAHDTNLHAMLLHSAALTYAGVEASARIELAYTDLQSAA